MGRQATLLSARISAALNIVLNGPSCTRQKHVQIFGSCRTVLTRANQFFKTGMNVDRLSQSIPNEFSQSSYIVQLELLISPAVLTGKLHLPIIKVENPHRVALRAGIEFRMT